MITQGSIYYTQKRVEFRGRSKFGGRWKRSELTVDWIGERDYLSKEARKQRTLGVWALEGCFTYPVLPPTSLAAASAII